MGCVVSWVKKELKYVCSFRSFIDTLSKENGKLGPLLTDLNGLVQDAQDGEEVIILETAKKLLQDMEEKHKEASLLLERNSVPKTCCWEFCGDCNCKHRRGVAKKADALANDIIELLKSGDKYITQLSKKPVKSVSNGKPPQIEKLDRNKLNVASTSGFQSKPQPLPATTPSVRNYLLSNFLFVFFK